MTHGAVVGISNGEVVHSPVAARGATRAGVRHTAAMPKRFIQLTELAEILDISAAQAYALVRSGEIPAIKVGGRGQWRVETSVLEDYIQRMYAQTRSQVDAERG